MKCNFSSNLPHNSETVTSIISKIVTLSCSYRASLTEPTGPVLISEGLKMTTTVLYQVSGTHYCRREPSPQSEWPLLLRRIRLYNDSESALVGTRIEDSPKVLLVWGQDILNGGNEILHKTAAHAIPTILLAKRTEKERLDKVELSSVSFTLIMDDPRNWRTVQIALNLTLPIALDDKETKNDF